MPAPARVAIRTGSGRIAAEWERIAPEAARALETDVRATLGDAVDFGAGAGALFATDASNYRQVPIGIVSPRNRDEAYGVARETYEIG
jgi:hypothetical protein